MNRTRKFVLLNAIIGLILLCGLHTVRAGDEIVKLDIQCGTIAPYFANLTMQGTLTPSVTLCERLLPRDTCSFEIMQQTLDAVTKNQVCFEIDIVVRLDLVLGIATCAGKQSRIVEAAADGCKALASLSTDGTAD